MRYIHVPADITITLLHAQPYVLTFAQYAHEVWLDDPQSIAGTNGGMSPTAVARWAKVVPMVRKVTAFDVLALEDQDYAVLKKIVEAPKAAVRPLIAVQTIPFTEAVLDAKTTPPVVAVAPAAPEAA